MEQLDPQVVTLSKAIRQTESGGNFSATGKSGEYGGYQYTEPTWNAVASKYGVNTKLQDATPEQQNEVTYKRIKDWKDKGFNPGQIASMWNAGEGEPNAYTGTFGTTTKTHKAGDPSVGVNSYGAKYDVPAYAKSVAKAYQTLKGGGNVSQDPTNPSSVGRQTFSDQLKTGTTNMPQDPHTGIMGENPNDSLYGKLIDNSVTRGVQKFGDLMTGGGSSQLGQGIVNGNAKDIALGGLKTGGTIMGLAAGGLLSRAANPLVDSAIIDRLPSTITKDAFLNMGKTEQLNHLGDMLSIADKTGALGDVEKIAKAIKSLNPGQGFISKILKSGYSLVKQTLLTKLLGDQLGHFIHQNTK